MDADVRAEFDQIWVKIGGKPTVPIPDDPDAMVQIQSSEWLENRCIPPLSDWLHVGQIKKLEAIAQKIGVRLICTHANPYSGAEGAHDGNAVDLSYFDTNKMAEFVVLMVESFKNITRSTIPNPTRRQIISAATLGSDAWNHDNHMHIELREVQMSNGQILQIDQILMFPTIRDAILAAA